MRPFPWDRAEVNMVGNGFSINLGFIKQKINEEIVYPIWVSGRKWIGKMVKEKVIIHELSYRQLDEIRDALNEAYNWIVAENSS